MSDAPPAAPEAPAAAPGSPAPALGSPEPAAAEQAAKASTISELFESESEGEGELELEDGTVTATHTARGAPAAGKQLTVPVALQPALPAEPLVCRLPSFMHLEPVAYDGTEVDEESARFANVVRWRFKTDPASGAVVRDAAGLPVRESNARFVRWSDGSLTLQIGAENFDVRVQSQDNQYVYGLRRAEGGASNLESMGELKQRVVFKPVSLQSEAHKALTLGVRARSVKSSRIRTIATTADPQREKRERERAREDRLRVQANKRRRRGGAGGGGGAAGGADFLEEGASDDEAASLARIKGKKRKMSAAQLRAIQEAQWEADEAAASSSSSSEGEGERGPAAAARPAPASPMADESASESAPDEPEEEEEEEEEVGPVVKRSRKVIADSDSDD